MFEGYIKTNKSINSIQTKIIEKELNPVWNKYGEFAFQSEDFSEDCDLYINVWDKDKIGSDDSLGDIVVPISKMKNRRNLTT